MDKKWYPISRNLPYMAKQKGIFPYDYFVSLEKLELTRLPERECFYNSLEKCDISKSDYQHAKTVWQKLKCRTFKDYLVIYLESDVLLLADIFEDFRKLTFTQFGLDPAAFLSSPHQRDVVTIEN